MNELYKITVEEYTNRKLDRDMRAFHYKSKNRLCNDIIMNYYDSYIETNMTYFKIRSVLIDNLDQKVSEDQIERILKDIYKYVQPSKTQSFKNSTSFTFRLNNPTVYLLKNEASLKTEDLISVSHFIKNILNSYARLSNIERERIIFKEHYSILLDAIEKKEKLMIDGIPYFPYAIAEPLDDYFGYLIVQHEVNLSGHLLQINKIKNIQRFRMNFEIDYKLEEKINQANIKGIRVIDEKILNAFKLLLRKDTTVVLNKVLSELESQPIEATEIDAIDAFVPYLKNFDDIIAKDAPLFKIK